MNNHLIEEYIEDLKKVVFKHTSRKRDYYSNEKGVIWFFY